MLAALLAALTGPDRMQGRYRCSTKTEAPDGCDRSEASVQAPSLTMAMH